MALKSIIPIHSVGSGTGKTWDMLYNILTESFNKISAK